MEAIAKLQETQSGHNSQLNLVIVQCVWSTDDTPPFIKTLSNLHSLSYWKDESIREDRVGELKEYWNFGGIERTKGVWRELRVSWCGNLCSEMSLTRQCWTEAVGYHFPMDGVFWLGGQRKRERLPSLVQCTISHFIVFGLVRTQLGMMIHQIRGQQLIYFITFILSHFVLFVQAPHHLDPPRLYNFGTYVIQWQIIDKKVK